jgi:hypothetical protein
MVVVPVLDGWRLRSVLFGSLELSDVLVSLLSSADGVLVLS